MPNFTGAIAVVAWLGVACFCGILPIAFAAILFFTSRKRGKTGLAVRSARKTTLAALGPNTGLVRVQGRIAPRATPIDGAPENALVYLRLKVEIYSSDSDSSGWQGFTDKARGIPFQLEDGSGSVWVNPDGLDKQLLGEGIIPDDNHIQAACILLGIDPKMLRGQLRFRMWELRSGQSITIDGSCAQGQNGLELIHGLGQPFIVSPLMGETIDGNISSQTKKAQTWTLVLGIPGALFLLCGLGGALIFLVRVLMSQ